MLNRVCIVGRLTRDPGLKYTGNGIAVVSFTIAVDREFKNQSGEKETDFLPVTAWRQTAEFVSEYVKKGRLVSVDGRLQSRRYEKDGETRTAYDVVADSVQVLDKTRTGDD